MRVYSLGLLLATSLVFGCSSDEPGGTSQPSTGGGGSAGSGGAGAPTVAGGGQMTAGGSSAGAAGAVINGGASGAGAGGQSGSGGGAAGAGGTAGAGGAPDVKSLGCGKAAPTDFNSTMYVRKPLPSVAKSKQGNVRVYELRLPQSYDMNKAYPIVFEAHGCDGSIPFHIEDVTKADAIVVALRAGDNQDNNFMGGCFATGPNDDELTEVPYFDAVVSEIETNLCVDKSKLFMEGYSSGSWLTNLLGCVRAKTLRGQGNATGGLPKVPAVCEGPIAAMLMHDDTDDMNVIAEGIKARDRIKAMNGCSDTTLPYEWDVKPDTMSTCVAYQGCQAGFPLIWCPTHGKGHSDQKPLSTTGLWKFWTSLP